MLKILFLTVITSLLSSAHANSGTHTERRRFNVTVDLTYNSNSIATQKSSSTSSASTTSSFTALELGGDFFFLPKMVVSAQMLFTLSSSIDAEISGFDLGLRYYPNKKGYQSEAELLGSKISSTPGWTNFFYGGFSNRSYQFGSTNISFQGLEVGAGIDYHFEHNYFFRAGLNYQRLQNTTTRALSGFAGSIGLGLSF